MNYKNFISTGFMLCITCTITNIAAMADNQADPFPASSIFACVSNALHHGISPETEAQSTDAYVQKQHLSTKQIKATRTELLKKFASQLKRGKATTKSWMSLDIHDLVVTYMNYYKNNPKKVLYPVHDSKNKVRRCLPF